MFAIRRQIIRDLRYPIRTSLRFYTSQKNPIRLLDCNSTYTEIGFDDGSRTKFNNLFLRDACESETSVDPHSKQKLFSTGQLKNSCKPNTLPAVIENANGEFFLKIDWFDSKGGEPLESFYSADFLKKYSTTEGRRKGIYFDLKQTVWNKDRISKDAITVKFDDYQKDEKFFYKTLKNLNKYGLAFVKDIPKQTSNTEWMVEKIANRIGYVRETFYGKLFDVKSVPKAKNIAYTNVFLPLHMDLLYYESPPGLQLLHSIKNSTAGGENIFVDSFAAANYISENDPPAYLALKTVPIPYHYENDNEFYYYTRPLIVEDETYTNINGKQSLKEVNYAPPFQAPFDSKEMVEVSNNYIMQDFLRGLKLFEDFINNEENQLQLKLPEDTCVIFDNRRVLHSRKAFEFSEQKQERWFKGCYVDSDTFLSRLRVYYAKFG